MVFAFLDKALAVLVTETRMRASRLIEAHAVLYLFFESIIVLFTFREPFPRRIVVLLTEAQVCFFTFQKSKVVISVLPESEKNTVVLQGETQL